MLRLMQESDIPAVAGIHHETFPRQQHSEDWIRCAFNAQPRSIPMVFEFADTELEKNNEEEGKVISGFAIWMQKSGFRAEAVVELELLAVTPSYQGKGIAKQILSQALPLLKQELARKGSTLKHIVVTTRDDNVAKALYQNTLGAEAEATITELYSADEVFMIARNIR